MARVSVLTATFDRAALLPRCIDSVLRQDFDDWELVVVDDGSRDETPAVLDRYRDPRIRVLRHESNRGVTAAKNTALDAIRGEWFTFLDSDDELVPHALSTLLAVPDRIDPQVDALTCNCVDSVTGAWTGSGLDRDQPLPFETLLSQVRGEMWGLTKTELLGSRRFNEDLAGVEAVVWFPISARARRYYVHQALRVYHTEGDDRVTTTGAVDHARHLRHFLALEREREYLDLVKRYDPRHYGVLAFHIGFAHAMQGERGRALAALRELRGRVSPARQALVAAGALIGASASRRLFTALRRLA